MPGSLARYAARSSGACPQQDERPEEILTFSTHSGAPQVALHRLGPRKQTAAPWYHWPEANYSALAYYRKAMFRTISSNSLALEMISAIGRRAVFLMYRVEQLLRYGRLTLGWRAYSTRPLFHENRWRVNPSGVLLLVAMRILRKPRPGFVAIVSRTSLSPLCYLIHAAVSGIRESDGRSLRPGSITSTQRVRDEIVSPARQR